VRFAIVTVIAATTLAALPVAAQESACAAEGTSDAPAAHGAADAHAGHAAHADHAAHAAHGGSATGDSAFAAMQDRGRVVMGVDQYTSTHCFDSLPDGGRIELQRDEDDPEGVATIRAHLREVAEAFASGDFRFSAQVHGTEQIPGTAVMAARRDAITYTVHPLPRGAEVRITTGDPQALAAIHAFLAFQRGDHRAGGAVR
jgi:hypothetical protein